MKEKCLITIVTQEIEFLGRTSEVEGSRDGGKEGWRVRRDGWREGREGGKEGGEGGIEGKEVWRVEWEVHGVKGGSLMFISSFSHYICTHTRAHTHTHKYTHKHIHIHTHTHTDARKPYSRKRQ